MSTDLQDLLDMQEQSMYGNGDGDGMGDLLGEQPLPLLNADAISLGAPGMPSKDDRSWSEVLRRAQDLILDNLYDFIRDHKPDRHEGRVVMYNLASAIIYTVSAQALQIRRQDDDLKKREKELRGELKQEEQNEVAAIFDRWSRGNRMQEYLACVKHRYGFAELERREPPYEEDRDGTPIPVTTGPRWDWYNAEYEMGEADREAIFDLSAVGYELYTVRQGRGRLRRLVNENRAKRLPDMDVSEWLEKLKSGKASNLEKLMGGTWLMQELVAFGLAHEGGDNPHWKHMERLYRGVQEAAARRSGWFRRKSSMSNSGGQEGEDYA